MLLSWSLHVFRVVEIVWLSGLRRFDWVWVGSLWRNGKLSGREGKDRVRKLVETLRNETAERTCKGPWFMRKDNIIFSRYSGTREVGSGINYSRPIFETRVSLNLYWITCSFYINSGDRSRNYDGQYYIFARWPAETQTARVSVSFNRKFIRFQTRGLDQLKFINPIQASNTWTFVSVQ